MKVIQRDKKQGTAQLAIETADDLWYLHTIISPADKATGQSDFKVKLGGAEEKTKVIRRTVWVTIAIDKTEFSSDGGHLRISGTVIDGSEEVPRGSHHALEVATGSTITLQKDRWLEYHEERLQEACDSARLKTLLVLFDRESAVFALLRPSGYEKLSEIKGNVPKKGMDEEKAHSFYGEIAKQLSAYNERFGLQHAIAASPAFWSEYLRKELSADLRKKIIFATVSSAEERAIGELLRRPELQTALAGERSAREEKIVENMLAALAKDKLVYGLADIQAILSEGNLSELTVTEKAISKARMEGRSDALEHMMEAASRIGAKVHLLGTMEAMSRIDGLGGVAGIRRW